MITKQQRFEGCLLGLACGDAVGTTVEFQKRGNFKPLTDMVGGGPFGLKRGEWTDDTSMALCIADSLLAADAFNAEDIMARFVLWKDEGYLSSTGRCFDIGGVTSSALSRFKANGNPYAGSKDPKTAGNGCLMRLAPIPMFYHEYGNLSKAQYWAGKSSELTHAAPECLQASELFSTMLWNALNGGTKEQILEGHGFGREYFSKGLRHITDGTYRNKSRKQINGTGYVVASLEAALWCFYKTGTYSDAVLLAANLGDDADTTAAIVGQLAGAYYGVDSIPTKWLKRVKYGCEIRTVANLLLDAPK